jgi:hypothetical protein
MLCIIGLEMPPSVKFIACYDPLGEHVRLRKRKLLEDGGNYLIERGVINSS